MQSNSSKMFSFVFTVYFIDTFPNTGTERQTHPHSIFHHWRWWKKYKTSKKAA